MPLGVLEWCDSACWGTDFVVIASLLTDDPGVLDCVLSIELQFHCGHP